MGQSFRHEKKQTKRKNASAAVTYNQRSFQIRGKPTLILSGSIHYNRVPPKDWNSVFLMAKELGLNAVQTYVTWSAHEPVPGGDILWEGYADLVRFIELAAANDLYVVLRIGPYICGEYYFGGIPLWMRHVRDEKGNQIECFRCVDPLWKREMKRWVSTVVDKVRPLLMVSSLASTMSNTTNNHKNTNENNNNRGGGGGGGGGPIIWMQIENEYEPDDEYLEWAVRMARNITTDVPWSICGHAINQCNQLNGFGGGGTHVNATKGTNHSTNTNNNSNSNSVNSNSRTKKKDIALCTINGFWVDQSDRGDQPSPTFFQKLWPQNPSQPASWTEDQGWFDMWRMGKRIRSTSDQLYGIARFLAYGGSYHNFYMLTGGNNYERRAGRDATTAYAADTAIDNLLLRHDPRFSAIRDFFKAIRSVEEELLDHPVPVKPIPLKPSLVVQEREEGGPSLTSAEVHRYGKLAFLSNYGEGLDNSTYFNFGNQSYYLPNHTVILLDTSSNLVLFNTSTAAKVNHKLGQSQPKRKQIPVGKWLFFRERVGYGAITKGPEASPEQLNITENKSDYLWYSFNTSLVGKISLKQIGQGGLHYIYVDGVLTDRIDDDYDDVSITAVDRVLKHENNPLWHLKRTRIKKRVDVLSVAMGLTTVRVGPKTGKGIKSVTVGNNNPPQTRFATAWLLEGEEKKIYTRQGAKRVKWQPMSSPELRPNDGLLWLQGHFDVPKWLHPFVGEAQPNQTALVVNLNGLNKGVAYVDGFDLGRYWLVPGQCKHDGDCAPPRHGEHCFLHWTNCGKPTQDLYHIPFEVLEPYGNTITLFEEATSSSKQRNLHNVVLEILHEHPN